MDEKQVFGWNDFHLLSTINIIFTLELRLASNRSACSLAIWTKNPEPYSLRSAYHSPISHGRFIKASYHHYYQLDAGFGCQLECLRRHSMFCNPIPDPHELGRTCSRHGRYRHPRNQANAPCPKSTPNSRISCRLSSSRCTLPVSWK